jgi:uncharacterized protein YbjT (DUF2867 family)
MNRTALIVGSSGLVCSHCLKILLDETDYSQVIALVRSEMHLKHEKLNQQVIDFEQLNKYGHLFKVDDVFCCLGTTIRKAGSQKNFARVDLEYVFKTAEVAREKYVKQFLLVSAMGANPRSPVFYNRIKGLAEESVIKFRFDSTLIFRPSLLLGERKEFRLGEEVAKKLMMPLSRLMVGGLKRYKPIHAETVAKAMVESAKKNLTGLRIFDSDEIMDLTNSPGFPPAWE